MPASTLSQTNGVARKPKAPSAKMANGAVSNYTPSPYEIMASRIANRVAEMAENITFVERQKPQELPPQPQTPTRRPPRKLEIRLQNELNADSVHFSPAFLDNTLSKMLELQNRMLRVGKDLATSDGVSEEVKQEQFKQSAELSRIIALICAEKARQGA